MNDNNSIYNLTKREKEIMNILWDSDKPLMAAEIACKGKNLTINTVRAVLTKLSSMDLILVTGVEYSGTVLSRCYQPSQSKKIYNMQKFVDSFLSEGLSTSNLVATLLEKEHDTTRYMQELDELERLVNEKKEKLKDKKTCD
ncbi:penicillinase repressor [Kineothrix alysoides]|uniref:Penicillinase repressor n=1 Tax=Kineothrix alysoides TaxID=1469948 RepID=A0A4R1QW68_9FIRM|nr:BlaI/MecI/CopY family transcriptional regulator [Kineothrix alysoides]TCL57613.1 penicillinase repressor [Kineothrix alysoides]